jgi:DNA modification methylase
MQNVELQQGSNRVPGKTNGNMKAVGNTENRNKRSVWSINTKPYSGAHFAVYPEELVEPMILAATRVGDIVLDPFFGSGTTGQVAQNLGRKWIGCELNKDYEQLQNERLKQQGLELV